MEEIRKRMLAHIEKNDWHKDAISPETIISLIERIEQALEFAMRFGGIDGDHHKAWVIDQMCRALLGDGYETFVKDTKAGEDGPDTYDWDVGIPP